MKIYLIPGLGYDDRIFAKLDFDGHQVECLNWIEPQANEPIQAYAERMLAPAANEEDKVVLIGHSFGGIIAQEWVATRNVDKVILVSSIKSRSELPLYFKLVAPLKMHRVFTKEICIKTVKYWGKAHGFVKHTDQELFKSMLQRQSNSYLQWALENLSTWAPPATKGETPIFQIHGTHDKTFPLKLINTPDVTVEQGNHIMLYKRHQEISDIIRRELETLDRGDLG